jgi:hypothetical protein
MEIYRFCEPAVFPDGPSEPSPRDQQHDAPSVDDPAFDQAP